MLVSVFIIISLPAQEKKLTLQECLQKAALNHPVSDQAGYMAATGAMKIRNLNRERVITAYFNILALQEQKALLELHL